MIFFCMPKAANALPAFVRKSERMPSVAISASANDPVVFTARTIRNTNSPTAIRIAVGKNRNNAPFNAAIAPTNENVAIRAATNAATHLPTKNAAITPPYTIIRSRLFMTRFRPSIRNSFIGCHKDNSARISASSTPNPIPNSETLLPDLPTAIANEPNTVTIPARAAPNGPKNCKS